MKLRNIKTKVIGSLISGVNMDEYQIVSDDYRLLAKYDSLEQVLAEWKDYITKEPLIKDDEVRTIISLWAKHHNADTLCYLELNGINGHYLKAGSRTIDIDIETLRTGRYYTVKQLCGE